MTISDNFNLEKPKKMNFNRPSPSQPLPCQQIPSNDKLITDLLLEKADLYPKSIAVESRHVTLCYKELNQLVSSLSVLFIKKGIKKNDAVFIHAVRSPLLVIAILATLKVGASFTLLDPMDPVEYIDRCIEIAKPSMWVDLISSNSRVEAENKSKIHNHINAKVKNYFELTDIAEIDQFQSQYEVNNIGFPLLSGNDTATITFTSGSSGYPKAVIGRHSSLSHFQSWMQSEIGLDHTDRFAMCSNLSHDPIQRDIFTPIALGAVIVIPEQESIFMPGQLPQWMREKSITVCCLTPPMCQFLTVYNTKNVTINSLRKVFFVGSSLLKKQVEDLQYIAPLAEVINLYGSTETQRAVSYFNASHYLKSLPSIVPIGRGMKDVDVLVINQETQKLCNLYEVGEIWMRSPYIAKGYLNVPDNQAFTHNPFSTIDNDSVYKTGDLGMYTPEYGVQCLGRIDDQVKIDGHRVELSHIDSVVMQCELVKECVTLLASNKKNEPMIATFFVVDSGTSHGEKVSLVKQYLQSFISQNLPQYMNPRLLIEIKKIPLTKNGKVDYNDLKVRVSNCVHELCPVDGGMNTISAGKLYSMVADVIGFPMHELDKNKSLDQMGLTSLNLLELLSQIKNIYSVNLSYDIKSMTVQEIVDIVSEHPVKYTSSVCRLSNANEDIFQILGDKHVEHVSSTEIRINGDILDHFCSNSYLGLGEHPEIKNAVVDYVIHGASINSHGAMDLNGKTEVHRELIDEIKQLYGCYGVLLYGSAYMANVSVIPALANAADFIVIDERSHQSIIDGCRLSYAHLQSFKHNCMHDLQRKLDNIKDEVGQKIIITEGLFSMEGTVLNLPDIRQLADRYQALLVVDEACSLGQLGADGSGVESYYNLPDTIDVRVGTLSKAIPSIGGYVATNKRIYDCLGFSRGKVFSGSVPPLQAKISTIALRLLRQDSNLIKQLRSNVSIWREGLRSVGLDITEHDSAITAIKTLDDNHTKMLFQQFYAAGIYTFPAAFPWNEEGRSLIRTSVTALHTHDQIECALVRLQKIHNKNKGFYDETILQ